MVKVIRMAALAAAVAVAFGSYAVEPSLGMDALPKLAPEAQHETATKRITTLLRRSHYKHFAMDDALSSAILDRYLENLDYNRSVFLQSDIDGFQKYRTEIDDDLIKGDTHFAYDIYQLGMKRRYERFAYALSLLDKPMDFTKDDSYTYDRTKAPWAKDEAELNEIWRERVKYDALNLKMAGKNWEQIKDTLTKRYDNAIKRLSQSQSEDVYQLAMNAFAQQVEPHTSYMSPRNAERFQMEMNLQLEGIGAVLQSVDDYTVIASLVDGGPADKSGELKVDDKIIAVAQDKGDFVDIVGMRLDDVVELIKGPKGSKVRLEVLPGGSVSAKPKVVTLERDKIRLEDRAAKGEVYTIPYGEYKGQTIGVINVPSFYVGLSEDVKKELGKLKDKGVSAIVMDLRGDGGGALTEASALSGLFIDEGPVVQVRTASGRVEEEGDDDGKTSYDGPMAVLIDRYSASASEIFAAAMQDYGRALIIGQNSYGKGTVQQHRSLGRLYDLFDKPLGHIQYTIAKFYRINGGSTQHKGVEPDVLLPAEIDPTKVGESTESNSLPWDHIDRADYQSLGMVSNVAELNKLHQQRMKDDPRYSYILGDIKDYEAHKDDKTVSLNEAKRETQRDEDDQKRLARINSWAKFEGKDSFKTLDDVPKNFELPDVDLAEAARITLDYVKLGQLAKK
ncbi:carboxy terminal-processing peptidase [Gallaecimonas kandeliae]|uniref:carboxy terminal-processing peptidase n=1 Tax=Gallaecimonas kandeliae TaxID=3029055 RepID=UPI0026499E2F|nr:carboxy terminal-processing peptidase [Gallaecimonas kandeliae]WKE67371.1 carboxy terminal-processing peptidase [Gallaecimonas kandeliae]